MSERVQPHDLEAERTLLGALLISGDVLESAGDLQAADFYQPGHRVTWNAMQALVKRGAPIDPVTLKAELGTDVERIGGASYIAELMDGVPRLSNVGRWADIIRARSLQRRLWQFGTKLAEAAVAEDADSADVIARGLAGLSKLSQRATAGDWLDNKLLFEAALAEIEAQAADPDGILGLRTGIHALDRKLQGIRPGQLGIIGGRLKSGKSMLMGQIAEHVAETAGNVRVFSLEMSGVQLTKRRIGSISRVAINQLHYSNPGERERKWAAICGNHVIQRVRDGRVVMATSAIRVDQMHAMLSRERTKMPIALVVVDYLQLVEAQQKHRARHEAVAEIGRSLKRMAVDLELPVIAVVQINRTAEGREGKAPTMADVADSDGPGRDCNWAVLIHRDPPAPKGSHHDPNAADLILAANRDGWTGKVRVAFNPVSLQFEDQEVVEYGQQASA